jgi:hydrogenase expression/formation protein HypC
MCLGGTGKIVNIEGTIGIIELMGVHREVSLALLKDVRVGEYVMVHAGCAIARVSEEEALETIKLFEELRELSHE